MLPSLLCSVWPSVNADLMSSKKATWNGNALLRAHLCALSTGGWVFVGVSVQSWSGGCLLNTDFINFTFKSLSSQQPTNFTVGKHEKIFMIIIVKADFTISLFNLFDSLVCASTIVFWYVVLSWTCLEAPLTALWAIVQSRPWVHKLYFLWIKPKERVSCNY